MRNKACMRAPQGQQAHSPGHRPGFLCGRWNYRAESAKAFALAGRASHCIMQPRALPWAVFFWAFSPFPQTPRISSPETNIKRSFRLCTPKTPIFLYFKISLLLPPLLQSSSSRKSSSKPKRVGSTKASMARRSFFVGRPVPRARSTKPLMRLISSSSYCFGSVTFS